MMLDEQISIVCFYWDDGIRDYQPEHVNRLAKMVSENLSIPYRFICVYDIKHDFENKMTLFNEEIELIPLPESASYLGFLKNPFRDSFPSSYRRLWAFSEEAKCLGDKILMLDIDCLILKDLLPLFEYSDADFVGWVPNSEYDITYGRRKKKRKKQSQDSQNNVKRIGGGTWLLRTGTHTHIWEDFSLQGIQDAKNAGWNGSDQAWLSYKLAKDCEVFPMELGIYHTQDTRKWKTVPENVRIIHFNGIINPWEENAKGIKWYCDLMGLEFDPNINPMKIRKEKGRKEKEERKKEKIKEMGGKITFVLFWWDKWPDGSLELGMKYIERLVKGIKQYTPIDIDYEIVLFTDQPQIEIDGVEVRELQVPKDLRWNLKKMYMYSEEARLDGPVLCLDLESIILDDLSPVIDKVIRMRNNRKLLLTCGAAFHKNKIGGGIIGFISNSNLTGMLWTPIIKNRQHIERITKGSERVYYRRMFKSRQVGFWEKYFPGKILSYKKDCSEGLPEGAVIIRFHGHPRPHEIDIDWVKEYWNG